MKRILYTILFASIILTGCSSSSSTNTSSSSSHALAGSSMSSNSVTSAADNNTKPMATPLTSLATTVQTRKMVIYNANLTIQVKNFASTQSQIEQLATEAGGYVLESTVSDNEQTKQSGKLTLRIPNQKFEAFLNDVAKVSTKVESRTVTGEDVTEQYVDLESTLKAKQQVEDRLTSFMQNAKNTEDLLKISNNLEQVQQDIETIKGKMKYLEVNSDLSKVTINISENPTAVSSSTHVDTSVWGKTKTFFVDNLNWLVAIVAQLFIFLVGASPTLLCLSAIGWIVYIFRKKRRERFQFKESQDREPTSPSSHNK